MDLDVTRDIFAIDENSVINREGKSNGTEMTSSIVNQEEVKRRQVAKNQTHAKVWLVTSCQGTVSSLPCHCSSFRTCREDCKTMLESA